MSYTNVFGGENINPADLSYKLYTLTPATFPDKTVVLQWPFESLDGTNVVADKIDVTTTTLGYTLRMPDATLVSVGEDALFNNIGTVAVTVADRDGTQLLSLAPGQQWYIYLTDNVDSLGAPLFVGKWRAVRFGTSASGSNAAALAGMGLRARNEVLDQNLITSNSSGPVRLDWDCRARVFRNTGPAAIYTIDPAASLGSSPSSDPLMASNGWFVVVINGGTGDLTLQPTAPDQIDDAADKVLVSGESLIVYCYGTGFTTMGHGRVAVPSVNGDLITVVDNSSDGSGVMSLSSDNLSNQIQNFEGTLTKNMVIQYGSQDGFYFVYNGTSGPFTLGFRGSSADTTDLVLPGHYSILRNLGGTMNIAFSAATGTVTSVTGVTGETVTTPLATGIVSTGSVGLAAVPTVTPDTFYGGVVQPTDPLLPLLPTKVPRIKLDSKGRTISASEQDIYINSAQIIDILARLNLLIPTGTMLAYGGINLPPDMPGTTPPKKAWLLCDGTLADKLLYPELWAVIGQQFGPQVPDPGSPLDDTKGQFRLPDTRGRVLAGADTRAGETATPSDPRLLDTPFFPNSWIVGTTGGVQYDQATIQLKRDDGTDIQVSGGSSSFGSVWAHSIANSGIWGNVYGSVRVVGTSDAPNASDDSGGAGTPKAVAEHRHTMDFASPQNGSAFISPDPASGGGRFWGSIMREPSGAFQVIHAEYISNVQPTMIIRHIIKT